MPMVFEKIFPLPWLLLEHENIFIHAVHLDIDCWLKERNMIFPTHTLDEWDCLGV